MDIFQCPKILVPTVFGRYYFMRFRWKTLDLNSLTDRLIHVQIVYPAKKASRTKCVKRTTGFGEPDTSKSVRSRKIILGSKKKKKKTSIHTNKIWFENFKNQHHLCSIILRRCNPEHLEFSLKNWNFF